MNLRIGIILLMSCWNFLHLSAERVNMAVAGANTKCMVLNTELINSTISRLSKAGGGTLFFPSGTYLTGSIHLKSNITLDLEAGAILRFSDNFDDYLPYVETRYEGVMLKSFQPLIYAVDAENITIKGEGTLDGQGKKWWDECFKVSKVMKETNGDRSKMNKYQLLFETTNDMKMLAAETNEDWHNTLNQRFFRPPFIQPIRCKRVCIEGVKIVNSPFWTVNPEFCDNVLVDGVTIINVPSPNTDGIDPESCSNVRINNCHISVGDDCVAIKSGRDFQGRKLNVPCENITITNCTMLSGHGLSIGSEMSGSVRKVVISNCTFEGTDRGIRIKSTRGRGGVVEDVCVNNVVMKNISGEVILLSLAYSKMPEEPKSERTPVFHSFYFSGIVADQVQRPIVIDGLKESPITDVVLNNIFIRNSQEKSSFRNCKNVVLRDVSVNGKEIPFVE